MSSEPPPPSASGRNGLAGADEPRTPSEEAQRRLAVAHNLWIATVRPSGRPHLVPVWFVWHDGRFYLVVASQSVKASNLRANPQVTVATEDASHPVICEGEARFLRAAPESVAEAFRTKYGWAVADDEDYTAIVEVAPRKWLTW